MGIRIKSTKQHREWWKNRKIDWHEHYTSSWNHPHRQLIVWALQTFPWMSLWEAGCASAPNLIRIAQNFQGKQLGGCDVNPDAIATAEKSFQGARFRVDSVEDMDLSDNAVDVVLADATLIYVGPGRINKAMHEITRVTRGHVVLCELHCTSWWRRFIYRLQTGYNMYDYKKLLEKHGFYDIRIVKIPKEYWPGTPWETYGHIIIGTKAKRT